MVSLRSWSQLKILLLVITHGIMSAPFRRLISFGKNLSNNCINADFGIFVDFQGKYVIMRKKYMQEVHAYGTEDGISTAAARLER